MKIQYQVFNFRKLTLNLIDQATQIINEYMADGYDLTLRQLYYRFVALDLFPDDRRWTWTGSRWVKDPNGTKNANPNYKWLGGVLNDGRLAGEIDWDAIVDRTRKIQINGHWKDLSDIIQSAANSYAIDTRATQDIYVEVWVEKEALAGVLARACEPLDVPYFSCKGYVSQSAMWRAACRIINKLREPSPALHEKAVILHLGDHDPSGIDMTRDIQDRLDIFKTCVEVKRIALNMEQIQQFNPPPNPAKVTDSRYQGYMAEYGEESWELDALDPRTINNLITDEIKVLTDSGRQQVLVRKQERERKKLQTIADNFDELGI